MTAAGRPPWQLALGDLAAIDEAVYRAVAATASPALDRDLARLSRAADRSVLWMAIAAGLAVAGGASGRRAAAAGMGSLAVTSALANAGLKHLHGRPRPDAVAAGIGAGRAVRMPRSASFPSGHAASAFAFATAAGAELPVLALPLRCLAAAVAYSRVHGGAHYPGDVIGGAVLGGAIAAAVGRGMRRVAAR
ncbi:MAG TPA: phosphatase PAP2 family protein [Gaiellales bacterium]|jgi:undecaprenyl-diphosphatase|nr:phosphatase PAP2 family protein [Gaiellales bacterium]